MTWEGHSVLAVVPARGGSKGIPRKNMRIVAGRSLVGHAVSLATSLEWVDAVILSTDCEEIADEGRRYDAAVPFLRPAHLASDDASSVDTWKHAWLEAEAHYGRDFDLSLLLEPTSPLRQASDLEAAVDALVVRGCSSVLTVSRTPAHYSPEKALIVGEDGRARPYLASGPEPLRQLVPAYFHRNGGCYAARRATILDRGELLVADTVAVVIERPMVNIDDLDELERAERLMGRMGHCP